MQQMDADMIKKGGFITRIPFRHIDKPPLKLSAHVTALGMDMFMVRYMERLGIEATEENIKKARESMQLTRTSVRKSNVIANYRAHGQADDELLISNDSTRLNTAIRKPSLLLRKPEGPFEFKTIQIERSSLASFNSAGDPLSGRRGRSGSIFSLDSSLSSHIGLSSPHLSVSPVPPSTSPEKVEPPQITISDAVELEAKPAETDAEDSSSSDDEIHAPVASNTSSDAPTLVAPPPSSDPFRCGLMLGAFATALPLDRFHKKVGKQQIEEIKSKIQGSGMKEAVAALAQYAYWSTIGAQSLPELAKSKKTLLAVRLASGYAAVSNHMHDQRSVAIEDLILIAALRCGAEAIVMSSLGKLLRMEYGSRLAASIDEGVAEVLDPAKLILRAPVLRDSKVSISQGHGTLLTNATTIEVQSLLEPATSVEARKLLRKKSTEPEARTIAYALSPLMRKRLVTRSPPRRRSPPPRAMTSMGFIQTYPSPSKGTAYRASVSPPARSNISPGESDEEATPQITVAVHPPPPPSVSANLPIPNRMERNRERFSSSASLRMVVESSFAELPQVDSEPQSRAASARSTGITILLRRRDRESMELSMRRVLGSKDLKLPKVKRMKQQKEKISATDELGQAFAERVDVRRKEAERIKRQRDAAERIMQLNQGRRASLTPSFRRSTFSSGLHSSSTETPAFPTRIVRERSRSIFPTAPPKQPLSDSPPGSPTQSHTDSQASERSNIPDPSPLMRTTSTIIESRSRVQSMSSPLPQMLSRPRFQSEIATVSPAPARLDMSRLGTSSTLDLTPLSLNEAAGPPSPVASDDGDDGLLPEVGFQVHPSGLWHRARSKLSDFLPELIKKREEALEAIEDQKRQEERKIRAEQRRIRKIHAFRELVNSWQTQQIPGKSRSPNTSGQLSQSVSDISFPSTQSSGAALPPVAPTSGSLTVDTSAFKSRRTSLQTGSGQLSQFPSEISFPVSDAVLSSSSNVPLRMSTGALQMDPALLRRGSRAKVHYSADVEVFGHFAMSESNSRSMSRAATRPSSAQSR